MNNNRVLNIAARRRRCAKLLLMIGRAAHAATVQEYFEGSAQMAGTRFQMHTMSVAVESFRENHAIKWPIEFDVDPHMGFFALHL